MPLEMYGIFWISILALLTIISDCEPGVDFPKPSNLTVDLWDEQVMLLWDPPQGTPMEAQYQVEMASYTRGDWASVTSCERTGMTYCDLTDLIHEYTLAYKVRVKLVTARGVSAWSNVKRFYPKHCNLQPPSFNLLVTSSSVMVQVYRKPILKKIFLYGMTYTIFLQERAQENKTIVKQLKDEDDEMVQFGSLHWGREYCVSVMVEANGAESTSDVSPEQCLLLPEQEWFIIAVLSLSILTVTGVLAILVFLLCCFLRRPEKMPIVLKSPGSGWHPLTVGEVPVEIVTEKGWYITTASTDAQSWVAEESITKITRRREEEEGEDRSMDSGVSEKPKRQEDSGFGSMGGPDRAVSHRNGTGEPPLQDGRTNSAIRQREDSGVGMVCQLGSAGSLDREDCGLLPETVLVTGDSYRSQSPSSSVDIHVIERVDTFKQTYETETVMAALITGYRSDHKMCICSGEGMCVWCQARKHYGTGEDEQSISPCVTEGQLNGIHLTPDTSERKSTCPSYLRKTNPQIETEFNLDNTETCSHMPCVDLGDSFPLMTALSGFSLVEGGLHCSVNTVLLSLHDMELTID